MRTFKNKTPIFFSIAIICFLIGCGNSGGSSSGGNSNNENLDTKKNKVYSTECRYALLVSLNQVYTFHKDYEYYHIRKADSLKGAYDQMERTLALYSPVSCQLPQNIVQEAKLKTGALDDEEIKGFLDQMMNESLLEYHQCQNPTYAKNEIEKTQCKSITDFVKDNGWVK
jgi:hypothetical protein